MANKAKRRPEEVEFLRFDRKSPNSIADMRSFVGHTFFLKEGDYVIASVSGAANVLDGDVVYKTSDGRFHVASEVGFNSMFEEVK